MRSLTVVPKIEGLARRSGATAALRRAKVGYARQRFRGRGRAPDFVGIGAQRCGTTWWYEALAQHPSIARNVGGVKELHILDDPGPVGEVTSYFAQFPDDGRCRGEWTPGYLASPVAMARLAQLPPSTKLLVLLRDPVERLRSAVRYRYARYGNLSNEFLGDAIWRSMYGDQLGHLLDVVARDRVLVQTLEQCQLAPERSLRTVFAHLDLEPVGLPTSWEPKNASVAGVDAPRVDLSIALRALERDRGVLSELLPDLDLGLWRPIRG